jgi:UDP-glucose:(heptosyl)LPS alpha-1,3-glucosyltransferase
MNIVFAIFKYFPHGGLQRDMMRIAEALLARGDRVTVFCHRWDDDAPLPEGLAIRTVAVSGWSNHARAESFIRRLTNELETFPHDRFVAFNRMPGADFYFAADNPFYSTAIRNVGKLGSRLLPRYRTFIAEERAVFDPAAKTVVMYLTPRQKNEYIAIYRTPEERFKLLPPGIPGDRRRPSEDEAEARRIAKRRELGAKKHDTLLLQVGSGFRTKGVDRSIAAFASLPDDFREHTRLVVAGRGKERPLKKLARRLGVDDRVTLLGARDDVADLLLAADLMIHPARNEATGTVLIEALAAGLPVLCSGNCGFADYVRESGGVVLHNPFSQRIFNKVLLRTLSVPDTLADLRQNALGYGQHADFYHRAEVAAAIIRGEA